MKPHSTGKLCIHRLGKIAIIMVAVLMITCDAPRNESGKNKILIAEFEYELRNSVLEKWYPKALDTEYGGYLTNFSYDWKPFGAQDKILVQQCRHLYSTSSAALYLNDPKYSEYARHGFQFIKKHLWDKEFGGFFARVTRNGQTIIPGGCVVKTAYGNAFAIFAFSVYYRLSGDPEALEFAQKTFNWLEKHSHDEAYKGYFDQLNRNGDWISGRFTDDSEQFLTGADLKDHNSSIHLLEAFSALYKIWPDTLLQHRLTEMLTIIRDTISTPQGYMTLYFERDWKPFSLREADDTYRKNNQFFDHVSFGHDIETAYLLLEASDALGLKRDSTTLSVAKKLVDHSLEKGWDTEFGGLFYSGWYDSNYKKITIIDDQKAWWTQAESLNSLLLMSKLFPIETHYYQKFLRQWKQVSTYQIDKQFGGWFEHGTDRHPQLSRKPKGHAWKSNYHVVRSLINCLQMLKSTRELPR